MKKQSQGILFLWVLIVAMVAGGTFLICRHLGIGMQTTSTPPMAQSSDGIQPDNSADSMIVSTATVAMQKFSNNGYSFSVPASWTIERTGSDTIALHPDAASPVVACKIELTAFPYLANTDAADWIAHRIGADPSLAIVEKSSEEVSLKGGAGVKWTGTIDNMPTTLVYAFNDEHAYEIAPSVIGASATGAALGNAQCD